jgi:mRNA-degrading endonuclease RelE of RelBE toxin-antitoxin system
MVDKITKAFQKFSVKERKLVKEILSKIQKFDFQSLDVKKLEGRDDIFRVRKGKIRIIYRFTKNQEVFLLTIERRSEKTYKNV